MKIKINLSTHGWLGHPLAGFSCKVVPRNKAGLLRTWPLLIVILRISSTHFLQRVRVKNSKSGARARASFFKIA